MQRSNNGFSLTNNNPFFLLFSMLSIENLQAGYTDNESRVLHGVSIKVEPNEIVALIGPNGSGKSTVLKSIFGLCDVHSGKIVFKGKELRHLPTFDRIREGIGFVQQGRKVLGSLTVKENLEMAGFALSDQSLVKENVQSVFKQFVSLKKKENEYAFSLSGGQQQLLAIANALVQSPQLILMDEPSLGLAPKTMKEIFQKVQEINAQGTAVLMVEQNAKQAVQIAHRTYVLENGLIALEGGKELLQDKRLKEVYFGGQ